MCTSPYTKTKSGIEIEICQVRGIIQYSSRRKLQYRGTDYNRYTVTVKKKMNNHKSVSMSNYKNHKKSINIYYLATTTSGILNTTYLEKDFFEIIDCSARDNNTRGSWRVIVCSLEMLQTTLQPPDNTSHST
jgi:superfamily II DNA helicase RecQ